MKKVSLLFIACYALCAYAMNQNPDQSPNDDLRKKLGAGPSTVSGTPQQVGWADFLTRAVGVVQQNITLQAQEQIRKNIELVAVGVSNLYQTFQNEYQVQLSKVSSACERHGIYKTALEKARLLNDTRKLNLILEEIRKDTQLYAMQKEQLLQEYDQEIETPIVEEEVPCEIPCAVILENSLQQADRNSFERYDAYCTAFDTALSSSDKTNIVTILRNDTIITNDAKQVLFKKYVFES